MDLFNRCENCPKFDESKLEGYGYCSAAQTLEKRAFFFPRTTFCWQGLDRPSPPKEPD